MCHHCDNVTTIEEQSDADVATELTMHDNAEPYHTEERELTRSEVCKLLRVALRNVGPFRASDIDTLVWESAPSIDYQWTNKNGKLAKRIGAWFKKLTGHNLVHSAEFASTLSRIHQAVASKKLELWFSRQFDWKPGKYGDETSCYFKCRSNARPALYDAGAHAIKYRTEIAGDTKRGRCWIKRDEDSGHYVIFNAYGPYQLSEIAHAIASKQKMVASYCDYVYNNGTGNGLIWINGTCGWIIHPTNENAHSRYDLGVDTSEYEDCTVCEFCGCNIDEDDSYPTPNGEPCCSDCWADRYSSCGCCGETCEHDEVYQMHGGRYYNGDYLCEYCAQNRGYSRCDCCSDWHADTYETDNEESVCEDCLDGAIRCDECDIYITNPNDITEYDDGDCICHSCRSPMLEHVEFQAVVLPIENSEPFAGFCPPIGIVTNNVGHYRKLLNDDTIVETIGTIVGPFGIESDGTLTHVASMMRIKLPNGKDTFQHAIEWCRLMLARTSLDQWQFANGADMPQECINAYREVREIFRAM